MTTQVPFWYKDPLSWDNVVLGETICPGSVNSIEGISGGGRKLDSKQAKGKDGASYTDDGREPYKFTIVCTLVAEQELREWAELLGRVQIKQSQAPEAFTVSHPQLAMLNVTSCFVVETSGLEHQGSGVWQGKIHCAEFLPIKGSKGGAGKVKSTSPDIRDAGFIIKNRQGKGALNQSPGKTVKPPKP